MNADKVKKDIELVLSVFICVHLWLVSGAAEQRGDFSELMPRSHRRA
jgi:hypothetical protein